MPNPIREWLPEAVTPMTKVTQAMTRARDCFTARHQLRVAVLSILVARRMGLDAQLVHQIAEGALVHDIGKIVIPMDILNKPFRLSTEERVLMGTHTRAGRDILSDAGFGAAILEIAMMHHERLDGSGYPAGLAGAAIPLHVRVVSACDVLEAMTGRRPYRTGGFLTSDALAVLEAGRGTHYDPEVLDALTIVVGELGPRFDLIGEEP